MANPLREKARRHHAASGMILATLLLLAVAGCGGADVPPQTDWSFAPGGVELRLHAAADLNPYGGQAHTLSVCVYQLSEPNAFDKLAGAGDGLTTLLACDSFDQSVTSAKRLFLQPGEIKAVTLDRAEKTKHVAIAAGYFQSSPDKSTRRYDVPVTTDEGGGLFGGDPATSTPGKLLLNLFFGPDSIQTVGGT